MKKKEGKEISTLSIQRPSNQYSDQKSNFSQLKLKQNVIPKNLPKIKLIKKSCLNQRDISVPLLKLKQNFKQKLLEYQNPKRVSRQKSFNLFPRKTFEIFYVCIVRNIKPCQMQLILNCVFLQPMSVNHPQILTS